MIEAGSSVTYGSLLRYVKPYRVVFFLALFGAVVDAAMKGFFVWMLSPILDQGFDQQNPEWVRLIPFLVIGVFFIRSIGNYMAAYGFTWVGRKIINDLRWQVFSRYLQLPQRFYDKHTSGGLLSRLIYDIEQMANGVSKNFVLLVREFLSIVFYLAVMFYYSWQLALVAFVVFPVIAAVVHQINKRFRRIGHGIQDSVSDISNTAEEVIRGHKIVKLFQGGQQEKNKFKGNLKTNRFDTKDQDFGQALSDELKAADGIVDADKRATAYEDLNKKIMEEYLPGLAISHSPPALVVSSKVKGLVVSPLTAEKFAGTYVEQ